MGPSGMVSYAKKAYGVTMTEKEAKQALQAFFSAYRGVRPYQARLIAMAKRTGYTWVNWVGEPFRRRPVPNICSDVPKLRGSAERIIRNTQIQGGAQEYMIRTLIAVHREWRKGNIPGLVAIINTVHDDIWLVVEKEWRDFVFRAVGCIAVSWPTLHGVPIEVDGKAGSNAADWKEIGSINSLDEPKFPDPKIVSYPEKKRRKGGLKKKEKKKGLKRKKRA